MKKRLFAILLVVAMLLPMTACGDKASGQFIIGNITEMSGDWETIWTNNAADKDVLDLISGYGVVAQTRAGEFVWDMTTLKDVQEVENADGSKTFTFTLNENLKWNDGEKVTAKDYVWIYLFLGNKGLANAFELSGNGGVDFVGQEEFNTDAVKYFSGLRLLGEYQFSATVKADSLPYYYDKLMVSFNPYPMHVWLPEDVTVVDNGNGIEWGTEVTYEKIKDTVEAARWDSTDRVSCGAYNLKSFDESSRQAILEANPDYLGNFEGQKPSIQKIIYVKVIEETQMDMLKTGQVDILTGITGGAEVNAALDLVEEGGFAESHYERNGYGKVDFFCDFGPTQFVEVRHAIAYLLDREEFANTFCGGYGAVVHGPYGFAMWMYQESKDELNSTLETYAYNVNKAIETLVAGGWTLNEKGEAYTSGIRYKKVTAEEAENCSTIVTLADGTLLMPLIIEWLSSENNSVSDLLVTMLAKNSTTEQAGVKINQTVVSFDELLNYMYRDASQGDKYGVPTYHMTNLATGFYAYYDQSYAWTRDPELMAYGYNTCRLEDELIDNLSMDMVYGVEAGDREAYLEIWVDYIQRWNELLPELPLYSNVYYDVYNAKLQNYNPNSLWTTVQDIIYCTVEE